MANPYLEVVGVLSVSAKILTPPTSANPMVLLHGTILAPGRRTATAALLTMRLANNGHFAINHRVLKRARCSPWILSKLLLCLITRLLPPPGLHVPLVIDNAFMPWLLSAAISGAA